MESVRQQYDAQGALIRAGVKLLIEPQIKLGNKGRTRFLRITSIENNCELFG